jgi:hypothetical protein
MRSSDNGSQIRFAFDSCTGRRGYENPAYLDMMKVRIPLSSSDIAFTSVSVYEVNKRTEYGFDALQSKLESSIGKKIKIEKITYEMNQLGMWLRDNNEGLHLPDDRILAYAMLTDSVLITCDKGLEQAARNVGQSVINPDNVTIDFVKTKSTLAKLAQSKILLIRQKMNRPIQTVNKTKSLVLKPGKKIIWRSFV